MTNSGNTDKQKREIEKRDIIRKDDFGYDKATNREDHIRPHYISDTAPPPPRPKPGGSNDKD